MGTQRENCYCDSGEKAILTDLLRETIPDEALMQRCCWREICRVKALHSTAIADDDWSELSRRRGYLLKRQNPRGF